MIAEIHRCGHEHGMEENGFMTKYIALLRGVNVGGNNTLSMPELKAAFHTAGFPDAVTYINSGNLIFSADADAEDPQAVSERLIAERFGLNIAVAVLSADELADSLAHAPDWWGLPNGHKHNAIFIISPATAESVCAGVGEIAPEYEKVAYHGKIVFWSAPMETFSRTRWAKVTKSDIYQCITIRNANTAKKLAELSGEK